MLYFLSIIVIVISLFLMNRDQLQNDYIESIIDGMDHKSMYQFVYDTMEQNLETYSDEELVTEVESGTQHQQGKQLMIMEWATLNFWNPVSVN